MKYMHLSKSILLFFLMFLSSHSNSQKLINILDSGRKTSLRGLSVVDDYIVWASGSNGTVARSTNGGKTFEWLKVQALKPENDRIYAGLKAVMDTGI